MRHRWSDINSFSKITEEVTAIDQQNKLMAMVKTTAWYTVLTLIIGFWACAQAGDDLPVTLSEEQTPAPADDKPLQKGANQSSQAIPQAENVNLKEVISEPLIEALPVSQSGEEDDSDQSQESESAAGGSKPSENIGNSGEAKANAVNRADQQTSSSVKPLVLLGTEVPPGTATRLAWSVNNTLAGILVPTPVLVVHGAQAGPTLCLTAAVHGDELNGIEVVRQVLYDLKPEDLKGSVIGVPIVNLQGFRRASRYLPDRRDLNRYFPGRPSGSSAARIAHSFFSQVVKHCDYLIDLHTGSFRRTNLPQLRADLTNQQVTEMTKNMGPIVVMQSRGARGSLRREALEAGVIAVTVEVGEPLHIDLEAVRLVIRSVETFLHKLDMYPQRGLWARKTEPVYYKSRWVRSSSGGILLSEIRLGERVNKGQTLGVVTDPITNVATPILSPISGQVIGMALNQVMLPGYAAYHIGFQATVEEAASQDVGPDDSAGDDAVQDEADPQTERNNP